MVADGPIVSLTFHEVDNPLNLCARRLEDWLMSCVLEEEASIKSYSIVFCTDSYLLDLNQQYLNHDEWTDIITFNYGDDPKRVNGEAFISLDRVKQNASLFDKSVLQESLRVIAHGLLHLLGYEDKRDGKRQEMRAKEERFIEQYP